MWSLNQDNMFSYIGVVLALITTLGCHNYGNPVTPQNLVCVIDADCVVKAVPSCCGTTHETHPRCVNKDYYPPAEINCSDNRVCAKSLPIDSCACQAYRGTDANAPSRVCNSVSASHPDTFEFIEGLLK
jgi:hypothetical protein